MSALPRVAAIHDMSGLGRCALTVILPAMSAMGVQVCPVPTAVLSAHMGYPNPAVVDLSEFMTATAAHWSSAGMTFDAIYSGFLATAEQVAIVEDFIDRFAGEHTHVLIDPVMADHGKLYRCFDSAFVESMAHLTRRAKIITPNLTEAALLLGEIPNTRGNLALYERWVKKLAAMHTGRSVVLTGVEPCEGQTGALVYDANLSATSLVSAPLVDRHYPGTGDLFASVLLGRVLKGDTLHDAAARAVTFISAVAEDTKQAGTPEVEGVHFEPRLGDLM